MCVLGSRKGGEKVERVQTFGGLLRGSVPLLSEHTNTQLVWNEFSCPKVLIYIFFFNFARVVCVCVCVCVCVGGGGYSL